jgi:fermentation-respiration switch protein FrsA (DUF1100 family)
MAAAEDVDESATLAGKLAGLALGASKTLGAVVGCGYLGVCALLYVFQRKLQYFPTKEAPPEVSSLPAVCRNIEDFSVRTEDGETIRGWYWAPLPGEKHADVTLLQLHGNAGSRHNRLYWAHHLRSRLGVGVALLDYRGYGGSSGSVTERGMILDSVAGIQWAATRAKETKSKLVLHLESIGSAAGIAAAAKLGDQSDVIDGIVVEGGLSSCVEIASKLFSFLPVKMLMTDTWSGTCAAASSLNPDTPFMSMHGDRDEIVPLWCGRRLFDAVKGRKVWREFKKGGHNNLMEKAGYFDALDEFYEQYVKS